MAISILGTADTPETAVATTHEANYPASISAGELLAYFYLTGANNRELGLTGWTNLSADAGAGEEVGVIWKIASGSETGTVTFNYNTGSSEAGGVMIRASGHDATTPFNTGNIQCGDITSQNPFVLSAGTLTGAATSSFIIHIWGAKLATRTISTLDSDLTLIDSAVGGATGYCCHVAYETGVTQNSAISTTMSDTRDYGWGLIELQAASSGTVAPLAFNHLMKMKRT